MDLTRYAEGYYTHPEDPGEASTSARRISVTDDEASLLAYLARDMRVLELGTGLGVSTMAMLATARDVTSVDPDPWVAAEIVPRFDRFGDFAFHADRADVESTYDVVFVDADHRYEPVMEDLAFAVAHVVQGLVVAHDVRHVPDVAKAMNDTFDSWVEIPTLHGFGIAFVGWDHAKDA